MGNPERISELEKAYESGDAKRMREEANKLNQLLDKDEGGELLRALQDSTTFTDAKNNAVSGVLAFAIFKNKGDKSKTEEDLRNGDVGLGDLDITTHEHESKKENRQEVKGYLAVIKAANLVLNIMNESKATVERVEEEERSLAETRLTSYLDNPTEARANILFEQDEGAYILFCEGLSATGADEAALSGYNKLLSLYTGLTLETGSYSLVQIDKTKINPENGTIIHDPIHKEMAYNDGERVIKIGDNAIQFGEKTDVLADRLDFASNEGDIALWNDFETSQGFREEHGGPAGFKVFLESDTEHFVQNMDVYQDLLLTIHEGPQQLELDSREDLPNNIGKIIDWNENEKIIGTSLDLDLDGIVMDWQMHIAEAGIDRSQWTPEQETDGKAFYEAISEAFIQVNPMEEVLTEEKFGEYLTVYSEQIQKQYATGKLVDHSTECMEKYVTWMGDNMDKFGQSLTAAHWNPLVDIVGQHMDLLKYEGVDADLAKGSIDTWTAVWSKMANVGQSLKLEMTNLRQQQGIDQFKKVLATQNKGMMNIAFDILRDWFGPDVVNMLADFLGVKEMKALKEAYSLSSEEITALTTINQGNDFADGSSNSPLDNLVDATSDTAPGGFNEILYLKKLGDHSSDNIKLVDPQFAAGVVGSMSEITNDEKKQIMETKSGFMSVTAMKPGRTESDIGKEVWKRDGVQKAFWEGVLNDQSMRSELYQYKERRVKQSTDAKQPNVPKMSAKHVASGILAYAFNPSSLDGHESGQWSHPDMYGGVDVTTPPPVAATLNDAVPDAVVGFPAENFKEVAVVVPPATDAETGSFQFGPDADGNLVLVQGITDAEGNIVEQRIIPDFGVDKLVDYPKLITGDLLMTGSEELYGLVADKYETELAKTEDQDEVYLEGIVNIMIGYIENQLEGSPLLTGIKPEGDVSVLSGDLTVVVDADGNKSFVIGEGDTKIDVPFVQQEEAVADTDAATVEDEENPVDGTETGADPETPTGAETMTAAGVSTEFKKLTDANDPKFVMRKLFLREIGQADTWNKEQNWGLLSLDNLSGEYTGLNTENLNYDKKLAVGSSFTVPSTTQENSNLQNASYETAGEKKPFNTYMQEKIGGITNPIIQNALTNLVFGKNGTGIPGLQRMLISAGHDTGGVNVYGPKTDKALDTFVANSNNVA